MTLALPDNVSKIIRILEEAGFEAFAVGGCVRDSLLGRTPHDWDITTSARPQEVKKLFRRTVDTGLQHGTVTVLMRGEALEVTTYRIDGTYSDARHPDSVTFTPELKEDLKRRDFTVNAMAYNGRCGLVDEFGGVKDIKEKRIRAVGEAEERFREDALRILRAFRFASELGFSIENKTRLAAGALAESLRQISAERIRSELFRLLVSPHPELLRDMYEAGITRVFIPEFDRCMEQEQNHPHHCFNVGEHTIRAMCALSPEPEAGEDTFFQDPKEYQYLRLALFFHDFGKPETHFTDEEGTDHFHGHAEAGAKITAGILRRLKSDNETIKTVEDLVRFHDRKLPAEEKTVRRAVNRVGALNFRRLFYIVRADIMAQSEYKREEKLTAERELKAVFEEIMRRGDPVSVSDLAIGGRELMELGVPKGPEVGAVLRKLLEAVLENPECNTEERLKELVMEEKAEK
ncbi:MAG: HD domain-containing protein [Lachnospiraceae bacterium]|nr:HD domain-containing protein [Lachnospiraceae bacterium]